MRRRMAMGLAGGLLLGLAPAVSAGEDWCMMDPAVPVKTPGGNVVVVHLNVYAPSAEYREALARSSHSYVARRGDASDTTLVEVSVVIPDSRRGVRFPSRAVVTTGPQATGDTLGEATGVSGAPLLVQFALNTP